MIEQKYTADTLAALPNAELDTLAAKARYPATFSVALGLSEQNLWQPTRDANQALALLTWAVNTHDFAFQIGIVSRNRQFIGIVLPMCDYRSLEIPGADARAMTIAFILAMQEVRNG